VDPAEADEAAAYCAGVRPWLVGALSLYCGDADVAEELAQDTLARVWLRWSSLRVPAARDAWTYRVGLNLAKSHYRRQSAERRALERTAVQQPVSEHQPDQAEAIAIRQAVASLPPRQRAALVLRYFTDLSVGQTAEVLQCAPGTVKALTSQALDRLREAAPDWAHLEVRDGS